MVWGEEWMQTADGDLVALGPESLDIEPMEKPTSPETEVLRRMSAAEKLAVMTSLIREAYRLKGAWLRMSEPELSEEELRNRVREAMADDRA
jgi:hypothetical protein